MIIQSKGNALVSITVPMYKVEQYVSQCIESCIAQTYENIEIILIDDGSPDNCLSIAESYAQKDTRIRVIHQENKGFGGVRNTCLDSAKGDYICFVDADDYIMPDFVEYMLHLIEAGDCDIAISKNCFTSTDFKQIQNDNITTIYGRDAMIEFFYPRIQLGSWNKLYRVDFIKRNNLRFVPELKTGEGLQFITLAASLTERVTVGSRKVYVYRTNNPGSATTAANVEKQGIGSLDTMKYIKEHLPLKNKKEQTAYDWQLWNCYRYCLRQIVESNTKHKYQDLYKKCIHQLRSGAIKQLFSKLWLKLKIQALCVLISPITYTKLQILKKRRLLKNANKSNHTS